MLLPGEHFHRAAVQLQVGQAGEGQRDEQGIEGHAVLGRPGEDLGRVPARRQAVQAAARRVHVAVARRVDACQEEGVDDVRQDFDLHVAHGHDEGRGRARARVPGAEGADEARVVGGDDDADAERAADEEDAEAPVHLLEGRAEGLARVLRLAGTGGDVFGADDDESGLPQRAQESLETAQISGGEILQKRMLRRSMLAKLPGAPLLAASNLPASSNSRTRKRGVADFHHTWSQR